VLLGSKFLSHTTHCSPAREICVLLPNSKRQHRTLHAQKDELTYALCRRTCCPTHWASYCAPCQLLCPVSAALASIFRMGSISTSYIVHLEPRPPAVMLPPIGVPAWIPGRRRSRCHPSGFLNTSEFPTELPTHVRDGSVQAGARCRARRHTQTSSSVMSCCLIWPRLSSGTQW